MSSKGGYNLDDAQNWLKEIEKIFYAMECTSHIRCPMVLKEEFEYWWENTLDISELKIEL
ncbi:hypothetical protein CR513_20077, partial [Mucuna pruriens]